jgi:replicative superfamily II helicase
MSKILIIEIKKYLVLIFTSTCKVPSEKLSFLSKLLLLNEFAKLFNRDDILETLSDLRIRTKYGVKQELLPLIKLEGVGRIRARALYNAGFVDIKILKSTSESTISSISKIGPSIAKKIKKQLT